MRPWPTWMHGVLYPRPAPHAHNEPADTRAYELRPEEHASSTSTRRPRWPRARSHAAMTDRRWRIRKVLASYGTNTQAGTVTIPNVQGPAAR
jgi:hypothetical protein